MGYHPPSLNQRKKHINRNKIKRVRKSEAKKTLGIATAPATLSGRIRSKSRQKMLEKRVKLLKTDAEKKLAKAGVTKSEVEAIAVAGVVDPVLEKPKRRNSRIDIIGAVAVGAAAVAGVAPEMELE